MLGTSANSDPVPNRPFDSLVGTEWARKTTGIIYEGCPADAAWGRWLDGDDGDLLGKVPRGPLKPA
jgi:hypothetical protein